MSKPREMSKARRILFLEAKLKRIELDRDYWRGRARELVDAHICLDYQVKETRDMLDAGEE